MQKITIKINKNEKVVQCAVCHCKSILRKNETNCHVCDSTQIYEIRG
jgi:Zn finger protein HypA/HybF involved in hydrogenase expression